MALLWGHFAVYKDKDGVILTDSFRQEVPVKKAGDGKKGQERRKRDQDWAILADFFVFLFVFVLFLKMAQ